MQDIIIKPIISEKSMREAGKTKYTFLVQKSADKKRIKATIEKQFKVHVTSVETVIVKGKTKRFGQRRIESEQASYKKAVVGLKSGEKIGLFDIGGE